MVGVEKDNGDDEAPVNVCDCCGRVVERELLPICCSKEEMSFLGPGYPLFFYFIEYSIFILLTILIFSGVYNLTTDLLGNACMTAEEFLKWNNIPVTKENLHKAMVHLHKDKDFCVYNPITVLSLANKRNEGTEVFIQGFLNILTILLVLIVLQFFRYRQRQISFICDEEDINASDYTVEVRNIKMGLKLNYKQELERFFKDLGFKVEKVTLCYKYQNQEKLEIEKKKKLAVKKKALAYFNKHKSYESGTDMNKIENDIKSIEDQLEHLEEQYWESKEDVVDDFCGVAFISVKTETEKHELLDKYQLSKKEIDYILTHQSKLIEKDGYPVFHGQNIIVMQAPDPTDVIWNHQQFQLPERKKRNIISNIVTSILVLTGAAIIYYLSFLKHETSKEHNGAKKLNFVVELKVKILALVVTLAIFVINFILTKILTILANYEKHLTITEYNVSLAQKLSIVQFINTALITFAITFVVIKNYFGSGGLILTQFLVFILNFLVPTLKSIINPFYILKTFFRNRNFKQGDKSLLTQAEAQLQFENPPFALAEAYAGIMKTLYFTCFYAVAIPIGSLISIFGLIILYWVYKYTILRKSNIPNSIGYDLSLQMTEYVEFCVVLFGIGSLLMTWTITNQYSIPAIFVVCIGILNAVLPMERLNKKLFKLEDAKPNIETFREAELYNFDTDYDRENPSTKERAVEIYKKIMESKV